MQTSIGADLSCSLQVLGKIMQALMVHWREL
jgi:hypothetical protein